VSIFALCGEYFPERDRAYKAEPKFGLRCCRDPVFLKDYTGPKQNRNSQIGLVTYRYPALQDTDFQALF